MIILKFTNCTNKRLYLTNAIYRRKHTKLGNGRVSNWFLGHCVFQIKANSYHWILDWVITIQHSFHQDVEYVTASAFGNAITRDRIVIVFCAYKNRVRQMALLFAINLSKLIRINVNFNIQSYLQQYTSDLINYKDCHSRDEIKYFSCHTRRQDNSTLRSVLLPQSSDTHTIVVQTELVKLLFNSFLLQL